MENNNTQQTDSSQATVNPKRTPKWLQALEAQSWQAELLISGLIFAGMVKAPSLLLGWGEEYIIQSSELGVVFLNMAFLFILCAVNVLLVCFGIHFILRSIWIAQLGLNSVFPNGINTESNAGAGPKYWKKAKEQYPDLSAYNQELDHNCSLIFSGAMSTAIMMVSFSLLVMILYIIFRLGTTAFPGIKAYLIPIGVGIYLVFLFLSIIPQTLAKKYPENKKLEAFLMGYGKIMGGIFSLYIFKKPINYMIGILSSNTQSKIFVAVAMVLGFFMGVYASKQADEYSSYQYMQSKRYFTFNNRPHRFLSLNYENHRPKDRQIFTPVIQSDRITGDYIELFIPDVAREEELMNLEKLSLIKRIKTPRSKRSEISKQNLARYTDFNQIYLNATHYPEPDAYYYTHPNGDEEGLLMYLPTDGLSSGKNLLEIRKEYYSDKGVQKIVSIPFYFEKD